MLWKNFQFRPNERPFSFNYRKYLDVSNDRLLYGNILEDRPFSFQMINQIRSFGPF